MRGLKISTNHRYFLHADGTPFVWIGDTAWELFHRCDRAEAELYLKDRAAKGFTVIQAVVLAELDGLNTPNSLGDKPLLDNDPTKPNEAYFKHVDFIVETANRLGLFIGMLPTWGDKFNRGRWGTGPEIFTPENARAYGAFIGKRYAGRDVIWIMGGDRMLDSEQHLAVVRAMAEGIRSADGGGHLLGFHPPGGDSSSTYLHAEPWLDFHALQSGHVRDRDNYAMVEKDLRRLPYRPCLDMEPGYEDHPNRFNPEHGWLDHHDVRKSCWWAFCAGACGYTYGCHDIWQMHLPGRPPISWVRRPWTEALHLPGSSQVQHARWLFESRPYATRVPDQELIRSDRGSGPDHIRATRNDDGRYAIIYVPSGQRLTVDLTRLSGTQIKAWWYNPRAGSATLIGTFEKNADQVFQPPFEPDGRDWVLVLDDAAQNFPTPGQRA